MVASPGHRVVVVVVLDSQDDPQCRWDPLLDDILNAEARVPTEVTTVLVARIPAVVDRQLFKDDWTALRGLG